MVQGQGLSVTRDMVTWYPDKIPPKKIPLNAVEREPVPTRVLNPNASEVSYKPKQHSYRKTKLNFFFFGGFWSGGFCWGDFIREPIYIYIYIKG